MNRNEIKTHNLTHDGTNPRCPSCIAERERITANRVAKALIRMVLEYGGSNEIDAINPRMRLAQTEALEALKDAGYVIGR
ncbi:hypothetical protein LCGC14_0857180 [marine sediment metagenome]|uniref:Uncharacterized protein n=1 Tax=marine sediment metagenome TaxID=412755 RepID=A0A0F9PTU1_9ZZZZ